MSFCSHLPGPVWVHFPPSPPHYVRQPVKGWDRREDSQSLQLFFLPHRSSRPLDGFYTYTQFQIFTNYARAKWMSVRSSCDCWGGGWGCTESACTWHEMRGLVHRVQGQQKLCDKGQQTAVGIKTTPRGGNKMAPKPMYFSLPPFPLTHFEANIKNNHWRICKLKFFAQQKETASTLNNENAALTTCFSPLRRLAPGWPVTTEEHTVCLGF